jgi:hypothetical protein
LQCKSVLRWAKDYGTRVLTHHNCTKNNDALQVDLDNVILQEDDEKENDIYDDSITM